MRADDVAAATRPREQVGVVDPAAVEGTAERVGDMLLTDDFGERCRAIGAIQGHASRLPAATDGRPIRQTRRVREFHRGCHTAARWGRHGRSRDPR